MFRCQVSGKVSKPREKSFKVVVETRPKTYYKEDKNGQLKKVGEGYETVKELTVREEIYNQMMKGKENV